MDPYVRYARTFRSPARGFVKESCFTLSDGSRVDVLRPQPSRPRRTGVPELHVSTGVNVPLGNQGAGDAALSPGSQPPRKKSSLAGHLVKYAINKARGQSKSEEDHSPLSAKAQRYLESREHNATADIPGAQHDNRLANGLHEAKAYHARSNPMPNLLARKSSADLLSNNSMQPPSENISPTAAGTVPRAIIAHRREGFSFHSEEEALAYQQTMQNPGQAYLEIDNADPHVLGRELLSSEAASMQNGEVSRFIPTDSVDSHRRAWPEQAEERKDSKVAAAARKFSEAMRKVAEYVRPTALRRATVA